MANHSAKPKRYGPWCGCGHHVTDHNGNYNGSEACDHCPCPRYKLATATQRSGRWDEHAETPEPEVDDARWFTPCSCTRTMLAVDMPEGAVYVGRPSKWGNPFNWDGYPKYPPSQFLDGTPREAEDMQRIPDAERRRRSVIDFEDMLRRAPTGDTGTGWGRPGETVYDTIRRELKGKDLACWCPLDQPCHADVLLELANRGNN